MKRMIYMPERFLVGDRVLYTTLNQKAKAISVDGFYGTWIYNIKLKNKKVIRGVHKQELKLL